MSRPGLTATTFTTVPSSSAAITPGIWTADTVIPFMRIPEMLKTAPLEPSAASPTAVPSPSSNINSPLLDMFSPSEKTYIQNFLAAAPPSRVTHAEASDWIERYSLQGCFPPLSHVEELELDTKCAQTVALLTPDQRLTWLKGMMPGNLCPVDADEWAKKIVDSDVQDFCDKLGDQLQDFVRNAAQRGSGDGQWHPDMVLPSPEP